MLKTSLVISGDSSEARAALAELDSSLARSEQSAQVLGGSVKGAGVAASSLAAEAQASARAASGMAAGIHAASGSIQNANIVSMELFHVTRSVTEQLAMGVSPARAFGMEIGRLATAVQYSGGSIKNLAVSFAQMIGIIKVTTDAEAAEEAASAAAAVAAVRGAAERAQANIVAVDTEVALAEAAVRTATTAEAEEAAQARLAAALEAVSGASSEAAVAQNALSLAQGRSDAAAAASSAATVTRLGATGAALGVVAAVGAVAYGAIKRFQDQVRDSGELDRYRSSLGLTHQEMLKLDEGVEKVSGSIKKLEPVTLSIGDVMAGLWKTIADQAASSPGVKLWDEIKSAAGSALSFIIKAWAVTSAGITAGIYGTYNAVKVIWGNFPGVFGDLFVQGVNRAIGALNGLVKAGTDGINALIKGANAMLGTSIGTLSAPALGPIANPYAGAATATAKALGDGYTKAYSDARKADSAFWSQVEKNAIAHREKHMKDEAGAIIGNRTPRKPKKESDHGLQQALDELDAQINGQLRLAAAYQVSDAAVIKAQALQKAEEDAIRHKGETGIFYEKELALEVAKRTADGAKTLADLKFEIDTRKAVNDAVQSGSKTAAEANQQLELEKTLRPLTAAAAVAEGAVKQELLKIIKALTQASADNNAEIAREQYLREKSSNDNEIEKLRLEATLIGHSTSERAKAIAQLEAMQKLREMPGLDPKVAQDFVDQETLKAQLAVKSPFDEWRDSIPQTADAMNEAFDKIKVEGLKGLTDGLTDAIMGTKSLGAVFHDVAGQIIHDLVQIGVEREVVLPLANMLFGSQGAQAGAPANLLEGTPYGQSSGGIGGFLSSLLGGLFGGGRASGGPVSPGQFYTVNENSTAPGLFIPIGPGRIDPPSNDNGGSSATRGEITVRILGSELLDARIESVSGDVSARTSQATVKEGLKQYSTVVGPVVEDYLARRK